MNKVLDLKCPGCASRITHNPIENKFNCKVCSSSFTIEDIKLKEKNIEKVELTNYKCNSCGAEISVGTNELSTSCDYCGNTAIIRGKLLNEYKPDFIIPFKTKKKDIEEQLKFLAENKIEIDEEFIKNIKIKKTTPIYVPFFLYSLNYLACILVDDIPKKIRMELKDAPIDGSIALDDDKMMNLFPYNMDEKLEYNHAYLSGHKAEMYDDPKKNTSNKIIKMCRKSICKNYNKNPNFQNIVNFTNSFIKSEEIKYILLPVWIIEIEHKNNIIKLYMNGQTKKIIGKTDYINNNFSVYKFILLFLYIFTPIIILSIPTELFILSLLLSTILMFSIKGLLNPPKKLMMKVDTVEVFINNAILKEEPYV